MGRLAAPLDFSSVLRSSRIYNVLGTPFNLIKQQIFLFFKNTKIIIILEKYLHMNRNFIIFGFHTQWFQFNVDIFTSAQININYEQKIYIFKNKNTYIYHLYLIPSSPIFNPFQNAHVGNLHTAPVHYFVSNLQKKKIKNTLLK